MVAIGVNVDIKPGVGPVFDTPIRRIEDIERLYAFDATKVEYIAKTIELLTTEVLDVPLIGSVVLHSPSRPISLKEDLRKVITKLEGCSSANPKFGMG